MAHVCECLPGLRHPVTLRALGLPGSSRPTGQPLAFVSEPSRSASSITCRPGPFLGPGSGGPARGVLGALLPQPRVLLSLQERARVSACQPSGTRSGTPNQELPLPATPTSVLGLRSASLPAPAAPERSPAEKRGSAGPGAADRAGLLCQRQRSWWGCSGAGLGAASGSLTSCWVSLTHSACLFRAGSLPACGAAGLPGRPVTPAAKAAHARGGAGLKWCCFTSVLPSSYMPR